MSMNRKSARSLVGMFDKEALHQFSSEPETMNDHLNRYFKSIQKMSSPIPSVPMMHRFQRKPDDEYTDESLKQPSDVGEDPSFFKQEPESSPQGSFLPTQEHTFVTNVKGSNNLPLATRQDPQRYPNHLDTHKAPPPRRSQTARKTIVLSKVAQNQLEQFRKTKENDFIEETSPSSVIATKQQTSPAAKEKTKNRPKDTKRTKIRRSTLTSLQQEAEWFLTDDITEGENESIRQSRRRRMRPRDSLSSSDWSNRNTILTESFNSQTKQRKANEEPLQQSRTKEKSVGKTNQEISPRRLQKRKNTKSRTSKSKPREASYSVKPAETAFSKFNLTHESKATSKSTPPSKRKKIQHHPDENDNTLTTSVFTMPVRTTPKSPERKSEKGLSQQQGNNNATHKPTNNDDSLLCNDIIDSDDSQSTLDESLSLNDPTLDEPGNGTDTIVGSDANHWKFVRKQMSAITEPVFFAGLLQQSYENQLKDLSNYKSKLRESSIDLAFQRYNKLMLKHNHDNSKTIDSLLEKSVACLSQAQRANCRYPESFWQQTSNMNFILPPEIPIELGATRSQYKKYEKLCKAITKKQEAKKEKLAKLQNLQLLYFDLGSLKKCGDSVLSDKNATHVHRLRATHKFGNALSSARQISSYIKEPSSSN